MLGIIPLLGTNCPCPPCSITAMSWSLASLPGAGPTELLLATACLAPGPLWLGAVARPAGAEVCVSRAGRTDWRRSATVEVTAGA